MPKWLPLLFVVLLAAPPPAAAWGTEAHYFIMDRAIGLLPAEIRPLFERYRARVVERMVDPDTWRTAGFETEDPNHFLDIDVPEYSPYPFAALPREFDVAVQKFGVETVRRNGLVPWRTAEMWGNLRRAFERYPQNPFGRSDILNFAAWLSHYVSDAHQPFHGIANYNGQLTGQTGVHSRFEATLYERYRERLTIAPAAIPAIANPRDHIFTVIVDGTKLAQVILAADAKAIGDRDVYDDAYYEAFFAGSQAVMERRLNDSIAAVAAMIAGAWEAAGKPAVPLDPPAPVQRRRR